MSGKKKLSDRLRESAEDMVKLLQNSNFVSKLLTCGELCDYTRALAYYEDKEAQQTLESFMEAYRNGIKMATNDAEKTFLEGLIYGLKVLKTQCYEEDFIPVFGPIPDEYWQMPQYSNNKKYCEHAINVSEEGSLIRLFALIYTGCICMTQLYDYPKQLPNFKPNPFHEILSYHKIGTHKGLEIIRELIDANEPLSSEEEKAVFETFKIGMAMECEYWAHVGRHWGNQNKLQ